MRLVTGDSGGVGGGVRGPSVSHVKGQVLMFGLKGKAGFEAVVFAGVEAGTPELQLAKFLVRERGRDLVLILSRSLA